MSESLYSNKSYNNNSDQYNAPRLGHLTRAVSRVGARTASGFAPFASRISKLIFMYVPAPVCIVLKHTCVVRAPCLVLCAYRFYFVFYVVDVVIKLNNIINKSIKTYHIFNLCKAWAEVYTMWMLFIFDIK